MNTDKIMKVCDTAILLSFYPLIYFLPISTALVEIFSTIILTAYFARQSVFLCLKNKNPEPGGPVWQRRAMTVIDFFRPEAHVLNSAVGLFVFINFLSFVFSPYPLLSLKGFIFKLFQGAYLYFAFLSVMKTLKRAQWFVFIFFVSISLVTVNGVVEHFSGREFVFGHFLAKDGRISSSFKQANDFGSYLLIAIFLQLGFLMEYLLAWRTRAGKVDFSLGKKGVAVFVPVVFILIFLSLFCLGFTLSRGAWVGFYLGLILLTYVYRKIFYVPILIGFLFAVVFFPVMQANRNVSFSSDDIKEESEVEQTVDSDTAKFSSSSEPVHALPPKYSFAENFGGMGRYQFWQEALHIIQEFPIIGVGFNTYSVIAPEYKVSWGGYPHNCYLQMAAETGAIGVLAFLWMIFRIIQNAFQNFLVKTEKFSRAVLAGLCTGLIGFLLHSLVDTNFYSVQLGTLMWLTLGGLATFSKDLRGSFVPAPVGARFDFSIFRSIEQKRVSFFQRSAFSKAKIIILIFAIITVLSYVNNSNAHLKYAKVYCSLGEESLQKGRIGRAIKYFQRAVELNPLSAKGYYGLGTAYMQDNQESKAIQFLEKTIELDPNYHQAFNNLGLIYQHQGDYSRAMKHFSESIHLPDNYSYLPEYRYNIGVTFVKMGDKANAMKEIERIINIDDPIRAEKLKQYIETH